MASVTNPFVDYLTRYTTASPDHEAAFDEFIAQAPPPAGGPLRLTTKVETFLRLQFNHQLPPSVILTGNAGDGKTYLCRQIVKSFGSHELADWDALPDQVVQRDGVRLHIIKDLSELNAQRGTAVLRALAAAWRDPGHDRYLIAANEGRLRDLLSSPDLSDLLRFVQTQLQGGTATGDPNLIVMNLTNVSTSAFVPAALAWMTLPEHWSACDACPIRARCPVRHNVTMLREPHIARQIQALYELLEHLAVHVTVRDMLIHLAYTLTGDQHCAELQRRAQRNVDQHHLAYYRNIWGGPAGSAFRRKASVVGHLARLRLGDHSVFELDDFIITGNSDPAAHATLFTPAVDLNDRQFEQDRRAYVDGGAEQSAAEETRALLDWLPHCRRKLFFEWDRPLVQQLIPFKYLEPYLALLRGDTGDHDTIRDKVVLGLNRAFSRLYLTSASSLYVTSQYLHSAEQPRPLVRLEIPASNIELRVDARDEMAYDRAWPPLFLRIAPPGRLQLQDEKMAGVESWPIKLLLFEYLLRLADGGTYNVLAAECELSVRNLKDRLLSAFAREPRADDLVTFFVAEQRQYSLRKLRIDENGTIRPGGSR